MRDQDSTTRVVLVTGFGAFLDVADNPSTRLARALDGARAGRARLVAVPDLPVSYDRGPARTVAVAEALGAEVILGIGVARGAPAARMERRGRNRADPALADVDGVALTCLDAAPDAPDEVPLHPDGAALAAALGIAGSDDAGGYVCNAWAYRVARAAGPGVRVCFLHVPADGVDPEALRQAIARVWGGAEG